MKETNMTTMKKLSSKPVPDCEMTKMADGSTDVTTPAPKFASKSLDSLIKSKVVGKMPAHSIIHKLKESIEEIVESMLDEMTRDDLAMSKGSTKEIPDTHIHVVHRDTGRVVGSYQSSDKAGIMSRMKAMGSEKARQHAFVPGPASGPTTSGVMKATGKI